MPIQIRTASMLALALTASCQMAYAGSAPKSSDPQGLAGKNAIAEQSGHVHKQADPSHICGTDENQQDWHQLQKHNKLQLQNQSSSASKLLKQLSLTNKNQSAALNGNGVAGRYYIPVVFHIYGSRYNCSNGGVCLTDAKIIDALNKSNEDFLGTNTQDGPIDPQFQAIRENLNVEFVLAKKDPSGNATNGIVRYNREQAGYGDGSAFDSQIAADAWDNFKYMNIYIMNDLYNDGKTNSSGVAWYPQMSMSQAGLSRVVYNGDYVGTNTSENFRSVLTHEFGHWLNLPHVFDGDVCSVHQEAFCSATGDSVCDTPQMSSSILQDNAPNCLGQKTNTENFMHYSDNYAMFTQGQVSRMTAALHGAARATLWSNSNLIATGLDEYTSNADHPWDGTGGDSAPQGQLIAEFTNLSANKGESDNYMVDIPQGTQAVAFYLDGYTEDPDLYVSKGTAPSKNGNDWVADYISFKSTGTPELVTITSPSSTETYHATVDAFSAYTNARLQVLDVVDPTLCSGCERVFLLEESGLASAKGATPKTYSFNIPSDAQKTVVVMPGGYEGDPDLYASVNAVPTTDVADCKPFSAPRLSEYCELNAAGSTVNIMIDPFLEYSGATIRVYYERAAQSGAPTADANGPYSGTVGSPIAFSSNGSTDSDGSITGYLWDFGDGNSSTDANPSHTYTSAGDFTATLTVTDNDGNTANNSAAVTVSSVSTNYCAITGNTGYEWIAGVTSGNFTHTSGKEGYKDNSNLVIDLVEGANSFTLTPGGNYTEHWSAYIDLNDDGVFDENSEKLITGVSGQGAQTTDLIIPPGHVGKQHRLRIIMKYGGEAASACGTIGDGEAEDYTVSISDGNGGGGGGGNTSVPDACATQSPVTSGRLEAGTPTCLGQSSTIWLSLADVDAHQSVAITTSHGTGNLDVLYKNGGWPSDSDFDGQSNNSGNDECIYLTNASQYWSYFKITGNASGATIVVDFDTPGCRQ